MKSLVGFVIIILIGLSIVALWSKNKEDASLRCPDCNVILIGVDTLRADHLSSYGYFRDTSPNIDLFAENGVLFKNAFSASSKTTPSFMSIFTSLYPTDHGILSVLFGRSKDRPIAKIHDDVKTLAQILKAHGYVTHSMVTSAQLPPELGFDRGFDTFEGGAVREKRKDFLKLLPTLRSQKFFIFFHDVEPHAPYIPPEPYGKLYDPSYSGKIEYKELIKMFEGEEFFHLEDEIDTKIENVRGKSTILFEHYWSKVRKDDPRDVEHLRALYDGEIKHLDDFIGELQKVLKENDLLDNTIIVFTADHGEEFLEHGLFQHQQLYNELLHVPLIFRLPKMDEKREVVSRVQLVDIMPTVLDFLGISLEHKVRGRSLLPFIIDPSRKEDLPVVSTHFPSKLEQPEHSFIEGTNKLILKEDSLELYNLLADRQEKENIAEKESITLQKLKETLNAILEDEAFIYPAAPIILDLDEKRKENLKSLGY